MDDAPAGYLPAEHQSSTGGSFGIGSKVKADQRGLWAELLNLQILRINAGGRSTAPLRIEEPFEPGENLSAPIYSANGKWWLREEDAGVVGPERIETLLVEALNADTNSFATD